MAITQPYSTYYVLAGLALAKRGWSGCDRAQAMSSRNHRLVRAEPGLTKIQDQRSDQQLVSIVPLDFKVSRT